MWTNKQWPSWRIYFHDFWDDDQKKKSPSQKSGVKTKKVSISSTERIFTKPGAKTKKEKGLYLKNCSNFCEFWGETTRKRVFIAKSAKKQFLLTNSGLITKSLGVSGLELHSSSTKPITFFGAQSLLG